ncbi:hypothetical protein E2562_033037 [Oryza meyeriana var. granulata]|uniref:Uncharacterized protein n=1 Tax=Oryza meyeriana var. granulata TaxID=110450 RepID=A0A6G1CXM9_9ORYZ|nr:hypothetical protein E2562_033037 [Oryza meyeriana var. granulata]
MRLLCCAGAASGEEVFEPRRELTVVQLLVDALQPAATTAAGYDIGLWARGGLRAVAVAGFIVVGGGGGRGGGLG